MFHFLEYFSWISKNRFCLKRLGTTTDPFKIGVVKDIDFRTDVLDEIVCRYFQLLVNNYINFAFYNSIIIPI